MEPPIPRDSSSYKRIAVGRTPNIYHALARPWGTARICAQGSCWHVVAATYSAKLQVHSNSGHAAMTLRLGAVQRHRRVDDHPHDAGRNGRVPARGQGRHLAIVEQNAMGDQQVEQRFRGHVVQVALAIVGSADGNGDAYRSPDRFGALGAQLPARVTQPLDVTTAAERAALAVAPERVDGGRYR